MHVGDHSHIRQIVGAVVMNPGVSLELPPRQLTYTPQEQYTAVCLANNL